MESSKHPVEAKLFQEIEQENKRMTVEINMMEKSLKSRKEFLDANKNVKKPTFTWQLAGKHGSETIAHTGVDSGKTAFSDDVTSAIIVSVTMIICAV